MSFSWATLDRVLFGDVTSELLEAAPGVSAGLDLERVDLDLAGQAASRRIELTRSALAAAAEAPKPLALEAPSDVEPLRVLEPLAGSPR